jgi:hypothetical protein
MVFTISPQEAQAMQEDEAQLIGAIAQAARSVIALAMLRQPQSATAQVPETLRIQMGRRLVYGQLNDGTFRNELTPETLKAVFDAVQRPVAEGVDPGKYRGKIPAIEIRDGDNVLFREERDGTVTVNAIQFQLEQSTRQQKEPEPLSPAVSPSEPPLDRAKEIAQAADYLLNPLAEEQPIYDSVAIGDYRIKRGGEHIVTVSRGDTLILVTKDGEVMTDRVTEQDWQAFQRIYERLQPTQAEYQGIGYEEFLNYEYRDIYELWEALDHMTPQELLMLATQRFGLYPEGKEVADIEDGLLEQYDVMQDILNAYKLEQEDELQADILQNEDHVTLTADVADATAPQDTLPAIAIAERETAKLPNGATKQLLQNTQQNLQQRLEQSLKRSQNWLGLRPENRRNYRTARAALELFNRGYERTGERSYLVGDYAVHFKGKNLYVLKDSRGELMRFKAAQFSILGVNWQSVRVLKVSDRLTDFQAKTLQTMQQNQSIIPQSNLDGETAHASKTSRVERTVIQFLQTKARAKVWDKEGGKFKLEIGAGGFLQITEKQEGRGVVFRRQHGEVMSKLNTQDIAHFDRLAAKMSPKRHQSFSRQQVRTPKRSSGLELA